MNGAERTDAIIIKNATAHNLKGLNVEIPLNQFTCVTGVSGGGKSSLVYDTLYAESQRAFLESMALNPFGERLMDKPPVDQIENLRPALNVSQQYYNVNPRSTVGTLSDISRYLRTLFALIINETEGTSYTERNFSPNDISGCCPRCGGLGEEYAVDTAALIPNPDRPLNRGGIRYYSGNTSSQEYKLLEKLCERFSIDISKKVSELTKQELHALMFRKEPLEISLRFKNVKGRYRQKNVVSRGAVVELEELLDHVDTPSVLASIGKYLKRESCNVCSGTRFRKEILSCTILGLNIAQVEQLQLDELPQWLERVEKDCSNSRIGTVVGSLVQQICNRVANILELNLSYLTLARSIPTLSGGELQRLRIGVQLSCPLSGLLYILDEPCRGLHDRNIQNIVASTKTLVQRGNTVVAIEHNSAYIRHADRILELGPTGGPQGGYLVGENVSPEEFRKNIVFKPFSPPNMKKKIELSGITFHNICNQNLSLPIESIICITGVSGSGKSSLLTVLKECLDANQPRHCKSWSCPSSIKREVYVNQRPIGKTPRSTVLSYLDLSAPLRSLFAKTKEAKERGLTATDFSINVSGGRCEVCQGTGLKKIELNYLPDTYIQCPVCQGKRFADDVLRVHFRGKNISEVLESPIEEVADLFIDEEQIYKTLECVIQLGLGYLSFGQMSMHLSGGEAQRIKLAKALSEKKNGKTVYLLDEPTSGLHMSDIERLRAILLQICEQGNTIVMIEHNLEFIASIADYMVDFGIHAGNEGGKIVTQGVPEDVCKDRDSSWQGVFVVNS